MKDDELSTECEPLVGILLATLHKKWSLPLRISSVNVNVSCGFGHIYGRNPQWKTSFFVQCEVIKYEVIKFCCSRRWMPLLRCEPSFKVTAKIPIFNFPKFFGVSLFGRLKIIFHWYQYAHRNQKPIWFCYSRKTFFSRTTLFTYTSKSTLNCLPNCLT